MSRARAYHETSRILKGRPPGRPDWEGIITFANERLFTPQLAGALARRGAQAAPPPDAAGFLADVRARNRERNRRLADMLLAALDALNGVGVEPVALKGCALWCVNGDVDEAVSCDRILSDLDLLIRPAELPAASSALAAAGFGLIEDTVTRETNAVQVYGRATDPGVIDLHIHPPGPRAYALEDEIRAHAAATSFAGRRIHAPSPEMQILISVVHDQFHDGRFWLGGFSMRHLFDIRDLSMGCGPENWRRLRGRLDSLGAKAALLTPIVAAYAFLGVEAPDDLVSSPLAVAHYHRQRCQMLYPPIAALVSSARSLKRRSFFRTRSAAETAAP